MKNRCARLFFSMLTLSGCTFGGGFVIIPLIRRKFVEELNWLSEEEMLNMMALAQSSPGAVTVNVAVQLGMHAAGPWGAACAVLGTLLPPLMIFGLISLCYEAFYASALVASVLWGMRVAVAGMILHAVWGMARGVVRTGHELSMALMVAALLATALWRLNAGIVLAGGALIGWMLAGRTME